MRFRPDSPSIYLPNNGQIDLNAIGVEAGQANNSQTGMNDAAVRDLIGKASGAQNAMSEYYGASATIFTLNATISTNGVYQIGNRHPEYGGTDPFFNFYDWAVYDGGISSQSSSLFFNIFVAQDPNFNECLSMNRSANANWSGATNMKVKSGSDVVNSTLYGNGANGVNQVYALDDTMSTVTSGLKPNGTYTQFVGRNVTVEIT